MQRKKYLEFIGCGRNRIVFRRGNYVFKFPLNDYGVRNNYNEARWYLKYKKTSSYVPYAQCRMFKKILVMEYVEPSYDFAKMPNWCYSVDCMQVGFDKANRLVAYDFG